MRYIGIYLKIEENCPWKPDKFWFWVTICPKFKYENSSKELDIDNVDPRSQSYYFLIYNASIVVVKNILKVRENIFYSKNVLCNSLRYNTMSSLVRFENKNYFLLLWKAF
jgi:hypothetical protein